MSQQTTVSAEQLRAQFGDMSLVAAMNHGREKRAYTHTFGCQQNEADTETIRGMLAEMGYQMTDSPEHADFILFNTCAVREHAEDRAFGNIGALSHLKKQRPDVIIALCGCMAQQEKNVEKIKKSYPQVSLLFGTHALWRFPSLLRRVLTGEKRVFDIGGADDIAEGLPLLRGEGPKAWLSIMYGCNNFCTYCIVPYVRGRERSRRPEEIEAELRELTREGYKDITLLGQNVNSYGKDLGLEIDFSDLLRRLNDVPGDFLLRFMTSHPKDASRKLIDTMAACSKVAKQLHLPVQSGSDAVLSRMNRRYTAGEYRELIRYAREEIPEIVLSSDIIVGFPGETEADFEETLRLTQEIEYDLLFTFLYSKRSGTPAASYEDPATSAEKQARFERLLRAQDEIVARRQAAYQGKTLRLLVDGESKNPDYPFTARTEGNLLVCVRGEDIVVGSFIEAEIEKTSLRCLYAQKR
ncbi:tRNA (N6-isopentenyl adenosine(37)-C2)-methylthiotransferase MiaB [Butyricicoccus faecihominis]|uniref:tRNA (N6-isopentenyl adenosine(37)-C2)-methylthiotransferase MiaB n=1 Tax=Butyricicoccus faecihominis TaxID=1712515 RepID=UPI002478E002|nr:tRNA (N6-isopentenyl adenosine(37)-C2)-methylthiotransferase MiaB [Butyricicoccus faecihominis]MCQ5128332.1 tRNA (N6-isopentenyl adenosine(37)-C2)-methylthiotransferase MiaB [Butyricicoccus faecihominis]